MRISKTTLCLILSLIATEEHAVKSLELNSIVICIISFKCQSIFGSSTLLNIRACITMSLYGIKTTLKRNECLKVIAMPLFYSLVTSLKCTVFIDPCFIWQRVTHPACLTENVSRLTVILRVPEMSVESCLQSLLDSA